MFYINLTTALLLGSFVFLHFEQERYCFLSRLIRISYCSIYNYGYCHFVYKDN